MEQSHDIEQRYRIDGLASRSRSRGWEDTIWLTKQVRQDHDEAIFGEVAFDFTDNSPAPSVPSLPRRQQR
jgi:iron complex outermembrane receptor protein